MGNWLVAIVAAALLANAGGCVIEVNEPPPGVAVSGPPPAPVREPRPPPPNAQAVWVPGYWHWTGMQYTWIPGHWEHHHPGQQWRAPRYSMKDGTYFYEPGGWSGPQR